MRSCANCGVTKPLDEFWPSNRQRRSWCKDCDRKEARERMRRKRRNPEVREAENIAHRALYELRRLHIEEYNSIVESLRVGAA